MMLRSVSGVVAAALSVALALSVGCARSSQLAAHGPEHEAGFAAAARGGAPNDAVARGILAGGQPRTIFEVRQKLLKLGGSLKTHIVANRGHENPEAGSFSFFETYVGPIPGGTVRPGEFFLGFFSERQGDQLAVQQGFDEGGLMIELIAWDYSKQLYNFWELIGTGQGSQWHYRGDTNDVLADGADINVGSPNPNFGPRLRCSGCHTLGTPIFKEIQAPHNDWWTTRFKLDLGSLKLATGADPMNPSQLAGKLFRESQDASSLASEVKRGIDQLIATQAAAGRGPGLKRELRSLFHTMEMNLATDSVPFQQRTGGAVELPAGFFVDARLLATPSPAPVPVPVGLYRSTLQAVGSRFAPEEAAKAETRHAFVVPVRAYIDDQVIESLLRRGVLDDELVADVLAVDPTTPVYSPARGSLIRYVPDQANNAHELRERLVAALKQAPASDTAAQALLANLTDPARTAEAHRRAARGFFDACRKSAQQPDAVRDWLRLASQRRLEVAKAETSQNKRGTILEPGFRVIFPVDNVQPKVGQWKLDPGNCRIR